MGWKEYKASLDERALGTSHAEYPCRLRQLKLPPDPVFLLGPWNHPGPHVAVVGARNATEDGIDVAHDLARTLAERGIAVVSGLARGIDAAAHEGALDAGGPSGAVLGTALDESYPREHEALQQKLSQSLGLMSEIRSGDPATPATFATRNRILAALADVVIVVQGRERSGSLITAKEAVRLGRPVGALPWDSREPLGEAPHALIRSGMAKLVRNAKDVLELLDAGGVSVCGGGAGAPRVWGDARHAPRAGSRRSAAAPLSPGAAGRARAAPIDIEVLPPHEAALYRALRERPLPLDHLALAASLTASQLSVALLSLELKGLACRAPGGLARKTRLAR